ncbi:hypothetical protein N657DRAFT_650017 [Parathielavia appendiculata]|uniref:Uncharacterized protein n=1 Tax=Parathielavia appendiculata TaxID=2587402 RepID=A0AAN6TRQ3_9PEZI|nr:hypothetical protein N657DRAFT_650017 [Parathielavia appendiculata]
MQSTSMPKGDKPELGLNKDPSSRKEAKAMQKQEDYQERKEHSKSGANTGEHQGMEYESRKTHTADVPHNN